ncbi:MAG: hypothetical protein MUP76_00650 [Acidimicrobiia bacterium]|nr:hypothetical protein [Acidimicrobiia bacterium]
MTLKRSLVGAVVCVLLAGCGGSAPSDPALPAGDEAKSLPIQVLDDARDVAGQIEQRQADLESMIP